MDCSGLSTLEFDVSLSEASKSSFTSLEAFSSLVLTEEGCVKDILLCFAVVMTVTAETMTLIDATAEIIWNIFFGLFIFVFLTVLTILA